MVKQIFYFSKIGFDIKKKIIISWWKCNKSEFIGKLLEQMVRRRRSASSGSVKVSSTRSSSSGLMNGGGIEMEGPLRTRPLRVVMAFSSPFGLAMVLLGSGLEPEVEAVFI
nr:hypothetical protein [Tanacetum cinerariifolium]